MPGLRAAAGWTPEAVVGPVIPALVPLSVLAFMVLLTIVLSPLPCPV